MTQIAGGEPLLLVAIPAILVAAAGWMFERDRPKAALLLRRLGYLGMLAAGLLAVGQVAINARQSDVSFMINTRPALTVSGKETVVPLASDGHFWITAEVNGVPTEFLVDTGATVTGISRPAARKAGIEPLSDRAPHEVSTANGIIMVLPGRAASLRFGNITVSNLDVSIPRDFDDDTNVMGMNLLSQLGSWRVEGDRLILVPKG